MSKWVEINAGAFAKKVADTGKEVLTFDTHKGLLWLTIHNGAGYRCGYVALPRSHPLHGKSYEDLAGISVHGGLTFSGSMEGVWLLGFDCAHYGDSVDLALLPQESGAERSLRIALGSMNSGVMRTQEYVDNECVLLADQLNQYEPLNSVQPVRGRTRKIQVKIKRRRAIG